MAFITCEGLVKIYRAAGLEVFALQGLDLHVAEGEVVAILGNSGSGKSTLLNVLGGLDAPSAGTARVGEWDLTRLSSRRRDAYRRTVTGFLWQNSGLNLLPYLTALDNVLLAMSVVRRPVRAEAEELLALMGIGHRREALPAQLSGGEQQRVALAVALAGRPGLLLADEPTGSLDDASAAYLLDALHRINQALGTTILLVTHDLQVAQQAMRTVRIRDGKVATETLRGGAEAVVLDGAGRLQIPRHLLEQAGIGLRAEVTVRGGDGAALLLRPAPEQTRG
jgi:putative ABC transport system ATP-binding protein